MWRNTQYKQQNPLFACFWYFFLCNVKYQKSHFDCELQMKFRLLLVAKGHKALRVHKCFIHMARRTYFLSVLMKCLFDCLEFIIPHDNFSLIWIRYHCLWRAANVDLCWALMVIERWGFFNVSHQLRHGPTVYNGHLRGPVTLTPVAEPLAVELSLAVFTT